MLELKPKLCPFLGKDCVKDECSMWVNDFVAQSGIAGQPSVQVAGFRGCLIWSAATETTVGLVTRMAELANPPPGPTTRDLHTGRQPTR